MNMPTIDDSGEDKNDKNKKNLERFKKALEKKGNVSPLNNPSIDDLAAEGAAMLVEDEKKVEAVIKEVKETNPYIQAKLKILAKMPLWKQGLLNKLGKEKLAGKTHSTGDDRMWDEFCRDIIYLGNNLSA